MPSKYKSKNRRHPVGVSMKYLYTCCQCGRRELSEIPNQNRTTTRGYYDHNCCGQKMNFTLVDEREYLREKRGF